jgi:crotonobetainyl-CoA:carnitine CoA-transferase CaiB-like acyl-CoA transferase
MLEYGQRAPLSPPPAVEFVEAADGAVAVHGDNVDVVEIGSLVAGMNTVDAVAALRERGFDASSARTPEGLRDLAWVREAGLIANWDHPNWGDMTNVFAHAKASAFEQRRGWPAQNPGRETKLILAEAGYDENEIAGLIERKVAFDERNLLPAT